MIKSDGILEIGHYNFDMENMTVHPKHTILPKKEDERKGISGIQSIDN